MNEETGTLLQTALGTFESRESRSIISEMISDHESTTRLFTAIVENREKTTSGLISPDLSREVENRLLTQVNIRLYSKVLNIEYLRRAAKQHLSSELKRTIWTIVLFSIMATTMATLISWQTGRNITSRIGRLREGAAAIGGGNLAYRIDMKGDDELSELSVAFDSMTEKLHLSYRELETEIAERKATEEALRRSEERFRKVFEEGPLGMVLAGLDYHFSKVNSRFCEMIGYSEEELLGLTPFDITHPDDIEKDRELATTLFKGEVPYFSMDKRFIRKDRGVIWITLTASLIKSGQSPLYFLGMIEDITDRKQAEMQLQKTQEELEIANSRFSGIIEGTSDLIAALDLNFRFIAFNRSYKNEFSKIFGRNIETGMSIIDSLAHLPEEQANAVEIWGRALRGEEFTIEKEFGAPEKERKLFELTYSSIRDERGNLIGAAHIVRDISDRKRAEAERERLITELESVIKELEGFTYSVSHDLRAPIRHISGFTQLLKNNAWSALDEKSRSYLSTVLKASLKMGRLVDELLEFSRMGRAELKKSMVDLNALLPEVIQSLSEETENREIQWRIADLPKVWGDLSMLHLIFLNLIGNSLKFTRNRSAVIIEVGHTRKDNEDVLFVRDNGIGFDMQFYDKLFGIFQRLHTSAEMEGTGIGLANVERVVHKHGGRVWAQGKVNEGAVFYFSLPKKE